MDTRFTAMTGCRLPLQLAAMPGIVTPELAVAVAEAGGLAMIPAAGLPAALLLSALEAVTSRTTAPLGVNFLVPFLDREALAAVASRVRVVEFFYGDPDRGLVRLVHDAGALACWQVGSADEARSAAAAGCDLVVAQGTEAGGHVRGQSPLRNVLGAVLDAVRVPVLAAGGIGTAEAVGEAMRAGAAGVRVGTRFVATEESGAHPDYIRALLTAGSEDTVLTETFSATWPDAPHRVLRSCVEAANAFGGDAVGRVTLAGASHDLPPFSPMPPNRGTTGRIDAMALYAGVSVEAVRRVQLAADVVRELRDGIPTLGEAGGDR